VKTTQPGNPAASEINLSCDLSSRESTSMRLSQERSVPEHLADAHRGSVRPHWHALCVTDACFGKVRPGGESAPIWRTNRPDASIAAQPDASSIAPRFNPRRSQSNEH